MAQRRSGQITVTTAGTAEAGPSYPTAGRGGSAGSNKQIAFYIKALSTNTGVAYVGNDGADDVSASNGFELDAGDPPILVYANALDELYFDVSSDGEGFSWFAAE